MDLVELSKRGFKTIGEVHEDAVNEVDLRMRGIIKPYKTYWNEFNKTLGGGIERSHIYVIGGRPGVSKSAFSNRLLFDICELNELSETVFLYWNFEMPNYQQIVRETSNKLGMSYGKLMSAETPLQQEHFIAMKQLKSKLVKFPIHFMDKSKSAKFIGDTNRQLKERNPNIHIVNIMDHTRLISKEVQRTSEEERITDLLSMGREIAVELESTTLFISQLNRNIESPARAATSYIPQLTDFFGSDGVSQYANTAIILQRPEMYNLDSYLGEDAKSLLAVHYLKCRNGQVTWTPFQHNLAHNKFTERSQYKPIGTQLTIS